MESNFLLQIAEQYLKAAKELEANDKIEESFKKYKEAANKLLYLYQNENDP